MIIVLVINQLKCIKLKGLYVEITIVIFFLELWLMNKGLNNSKWLFYPCMFARLLQFIYLFTVYL